MGVAVKRIFCLLLALILPFSLAACTASDNDGENSPAYHDTPCSKDRVSEFMAVLGEAELGSLYDGITLDEEHCYNVTPLQVAAETNIKIFKFSDSCLSFALIGDKAYSICESFGGYGFVNAVPWDYDEDGNLDLLVASSWGSGQHRSIISVFNTQTKESIFVYSTGADSADLFVATSMPSFSSKEIEDLPIYYTVYTANVTVNGENLADLSYTATGVVGTVAVENGVPVLKPTRAQS